MNAIKYIGMDVHLATISIAVLDVMYAKAPYTVVQRAMHIHPTVAEYLPTVLSQLEPFA